MRKLWISIVLVCLAGAAVAGQNKSTPFQATFQRSQYQLYPNGQRGTLQQLYRGIQYRNSRGSTYKSEQRIDPLTNQPIETTIEISNVEKNFVVVLYPDKKSGFARSQKAAPSVDAHPGHWEGKPAYRKGKTFLNRSCVTSSIRGTNVVSGEIFLDEKLAIVLYLRRIVKSPDGFRAERVTEMTELKEGVEPNPKVFEIPPGYVIQE